MKIIWTPEAHSSQLANLEYLEQEWPNAVMLEYLEEVDSVLQQITLNPQLFPVHDTGRKIHRCVVVEQITLYYRIVDDKTIFLLSFWSNAMNPDRLNL